jgi:hypothetical protein
MAAYAAFGLMVAALFIMAPPHRPGRLRSAARKRCAAAGG